MIPKLKIDAGDLGKALAASTGGNEDVQVVDTTSPVSQDPDEVAQQIAGAIYGGVEPGSDAWVRCKNAALLAMASPLYKPGRLVGAPGHAEAVHKAAAKFNAKNPIGTWGFVKNLDGNKVLVRIDGAALAYPDPFKGEIGMVFLWPVGWRPITEFERKIADPNADAAEMMQYAAHFVGAHRISMAENMYYAAMRADPTFWRAPNELGVMLHLQGRYEEAIKALDRAIELEPSAGEPYNNRSLAKRCIGECLSALEDAEKAQQFMPDVDLLVLNKATLLDDLNRTDEAIAILGDYVTRRPDKYNIAHNRSLILLNNGRFSEGWKAYDARLMQPSANVHYEHYNVPRWQPGDPLDGKEVVVWTEQGLGDEMLTLSMIPDLIKAGAKIDLLCSKNLEPLAIRSLGTSVSVWQRPSLTHLDMFQRKPLKPEYMPTLFKTHTPDYQMSQADLGRAFRPDFESFPGTPFLTADETEARLHKGFLRDGDKPLVGISWHSQRNQTIGQFKSIALKKWAPILKTPGVRFVNLQYGDCAAELAAIKAEFGVEILQPKDDPLLSIDDFAGMVKAMDLVISVSNTTVHVAGALGVPCWAMIPDGPGRLWYFFKNRDDLPWYRSVDLYRQKASMHWDDVIENVATDLRAFAGNP